MGTGQVRRLEKAARLIDEAKIELEAVELSSHLDLEARKNLAIASALVELAINWHTRESPLIESAGA